MVKRRNSVINSAEFYATETPASGYSFKGRYIYKDGAANGYLLSTADVIYSYNTLTIPAEYTDGDTLEIKAVFEQDALRNAALTWLGNYDSANTYPISTTDEMRYFAYAVNNLGKDFAGKSVTLEKSLDFTGSTDFAPVGNTVNSFNGSFDGKNNTISGITCTDPSIERSAIFVSTASKSTIANLKVKDCTFGTISGRSYSGGIVAEARGKIENCTAENITLSGVKSGGIIGYADGLTLTGATVSGITGAAGALAGQINAGTTTLTDITVSAADRALISTAYGANGSITLSGNNVITAASIISESTENKHFTAYNPGGEN